MAQIRIFSHGRARAGEEGRLRELVLELLDSAKADKGTEIYEAFESMDGRDFIFRIQYATRDDFEEHVKISGWLVSCRRSAPSWTVR